MHKHVDKGYIYLPMGFALLVELLQMRYLANRKRVDTKPKN
jgi:predicted tellurium resistance membrane protein TerC